MPVVIDYGPLAAAADLLYNSALVAERYAAIKPFFDAHEAAVIEPVRSIISKGRDYSAADLYAAQTKLRAYGQQAAAMWDDIDLLLVPTAPTHYTLADMQADPVALNRNLGEYTNFVNLLDYAAIAVPSSLRADGLPFGVTLIGPCGSDWQLAELGQRLHHSTGLKQGVTGLNLPEAKVIAGLFAIEKEATMADLKGKKVGSGPGIQNVTLAKTIFERGGATGVTVVELPIGQHVAALAAGQIDGCYTLEPTGTIGRLNGTTRVLEAGVISKYVLGDPMAPWFGGSAALTSAFIKKHPDDAKKYIAAYAKGVNYVRTKNTEARQYLKGYTAIEGPLTGEVPLAAYTMYNEFTAADIGHFQKFFDLFTDRGVFPSRLMVDTMIYKG